MTYCNKLLSPLKVLGGDDVKRNEDITPSLISLPDGHNIYDVTAGA